MPNNSPEPGREGTDSLDFTYVLRDCLSCAVISVDEQRKVTGFNLKAEILTRLKAEQVLGKSVELLPIPLQRAIAETLASGKPISDRQIRLHDGGRSDQVIQINTTPSRTESGKVSGIVAVLNDVSTAQKWEANMRRLDRLHSVGTLSASMAHEVKNAFVAVKTFVDLLLENNKQADLAEIVQMEMGRIDSILGQMLKFSGPAKPAFAPIQLRFVLDKSLHLIQHLMEDKKIKLTRTFNAAPDSLNGDADQLEQAFINLFFNALDAMAPNGRLTVSTELIPAGSTIVSLPGGKNGPLLRVVVQDNGVGITTENMDRLFEPFFTTKPEGTGLGLAITRRIIEEHHGGITVESGVNKGTAFSLVLPASNGQH
ncbi:MAG: hypothetical protein JWR19_691 [Pedosphaera sp.]|nr:hypothetical protein [Pedosphaera sp.]